MTEQHQNSVQPWKNLNSWGENLNSSGQVRSGFKIRFKDLIKLEPTEQAETFSVLRIPVLFTTFASFQRFFFFFLCCFFNITLQLPDGQHLPLPPVILGELGKDPQNPTVCFYGHVDVQPARREDGWKTDPYTLTEIDGVYLVIVFVSLFGSVTLGSPVGGSSLYT